MRVAAIGDNCIDVYPELDKAYPTGNAVDFAVNMLKLGMPTAMIGVTGNDASGRWMRDVLAREGLDTSRFRAGDGPTAIAYLEMDGHECLHVRYLEGVLSGVRYADDQIAFAATHDLIHSTPWGHIDQHLPALKANGALLSFDYSNRPSSPEVGRSLPFVDYAFFSMSGRAEEAPSVVRAAVARGPRVAVATLGREGSLAWDGATFYRQGIVPAEVVNTVGGGDSFIAGFMHATLRDADVPEALAAGARLAARVIGVFGPWIGAEIGRAPAEIGPL